MCRRPGSPPAPEHHLRFRLPVADAGLAPPALLLLLVPAVLPRSGQRRAADPPAAKAAATSQQCIPCDAVRQLPANPVRTR